MKSLLSASMLALLICCRRETVEPPPASTPPPSAPEAVTETVTRAPECVSAAHRLCPLDQGPTDPSFAAFRKQMLEAVQAGDEAKLVTMVDPKIRTSFGDGGGVDDFRKSWKTSELEQILTLGGSFQGEGEGRMFWAPYVYANWPEAIDAFQHVAPIRAAVPIRQTAAESSPEVAVVDWAILELIPDANQSSDASWRHVRTPDKKEGWVRSTDVRSPIGYRAGFSKRSGEWKMEALVAGD